MKEVHHIKLRFRWAEKRSGQLVPVDVDDNAVLEAKHVRYFAGKPEWDGESGSKGGLRITIDPPAHEWRLSPPEPTSRLNALARRVFPRWFREGDGIFVDSVKLVDEESGIALSYYRTAMRLLPGDSLKVTHQPYPERAYEPIHD